MSAEIQTSLFILTAEIAGVATVAALVAAGLSWARGKARMQAAEALRAASSRLPGEGEVVARERALLGEFARAYLTRDAEVLAALPAQLLALRQMYEGLQVADGSDVSPLAEELRTENAALQARADALEQQRSLTAQQLEGTLATINTLVQEYGRGRGEMVTPTAEALLQALLQISGTHRDAAPTLVSEAAAPARDDQDRDDEGDAEDRAEEPSSVEAELTPSVSSEVPEVFMDLAAEASAGHGEPEPGGESGIGPEVEPAPAAPAVGVEDIDALLADVLGAEAAVQPASATELKVETPAVKPPEVSEAEMDLSELMPEPEPVPQPKDDLDDLDIDALLDAEMGRQAKLLEGASGTPEDLDLARTDSAPEKRP
ncbi:MAG: hypothetical protein ACOZAQ_06250 [Pseudomonadota bacterium]